MMRTEASARYTPVAGYGKPAAGGRSCLNLVRSVASQIAYPQLMSCS